MRHLYLWAKLSPDGEIIEDCGVLTHTSTDNEEIYKMIQNKHGYTRDRNPIFIAWDLYDTPAMESLSLRSIIDAFRYDTYCWGGKTLDECIKRENNISN